MPGEFYPLDNPQQDINIPQWGGENTTWHLNMLQLMQAYAERLSMVSDVQLGRVPTGKASALRTMGTTMALLGQSDVRGEQILRRLYSGLAQIYQLVHRLNRRYLPDTKEIRVLGAPKPGEEAYVEVARDMLDVEVDFDFAAALLSANKQGMSQSLTAFVGLAMSPIVLQSGLVTPTEIYAMLHDLAKSLALDADKYIKPPSGEVGTPLSAEEVMTLLVETGTLPSDVHPREPPEAHVARLQELLQVMQPQVPGEVGIQLTSSAQEALRQYLQRVQAQQQAAQQQTMLAQMAAGGQAPAAPSQGPGGVLTTVAPPPPQTAQPNRPLNGGGPPV